MESKRVSVEWVGSRHHYGDGMSMLPPPSSVVLASVLPSTGRSSIFEKLAGRGLAGKTCAAFMLSFAVLSAVIIIAGFTVATAAQEEDRATATAVPTLRVEGLILARCSICHSVDLIEQQRLPRVKWEATVEKMKHWGAEISDDEADLLVRYLSSRYHTEAPKQLPPSDSESRKVEPLTQEPPAEGPLVGIAARGAVIFEHNCQACHGAMAIGGMGPKLVKNPILKHEDLFRDAVLHGRGQMPGWGAVLSGQDIADIFAWLESR